MAQAQEEYKAKKERNLDISRIDGKYQAIYNDYEEDTKTIVLKNRLSGSDRHETNAKVFNKFYSNVELSSILVTKSVSTPWGILQSQKQVLAGKHFKHV
ncbi:hypothetical protein CHI06_18740 [Bacillus sp. 7884-1]|nr:hypothetical protein CHI06_18740 [Bacillus sp. 7884-1]